MLILLLTLEFQPRLVRCRESDWGLHGECAHALRGGDDVVVEVSQRGVGVVRHGEERCWVGEVVCLLLVLLVLLVLLGQ